MSKHSDISKKNHIACELVLNLIALFIFGIFIGIAYQIIGYFGHSNVFAILPLAFLGVATGTILGIFSFWMSNQYKRKIYTRLQYTFFIILGASVLSFVAAVIALVILFNLEAFT